MPKRHSTILGLLAICVLLQACATTSMPGQETTIDRLDQANHAFEKANFGEAERHYAEITKQAPQLALPHFRLGLIAYRRDDLQQASDHFQTLLKHDSNHAPGIHNLAVIHLEQARRLFNRYEQLAPEAASSPRIINVRRAIEAMKDEPGAQE